jgi:hypothetical protein
MVIKIDQDFSTARPSKIYPNWNFCFENKPSGNPTRDSKTEEFKCNGFAGGTPLVGMK